uniref:Xin actin binding repeat containing 2 n=1 Tax=Poecilia reticulata TaxID=8081 RepID=A0A3P9NMJ1_POERE
MPSFNIQVIRNVFELGEQCFSVTEERKDQEELVSSLCKTRADSSKLERSHETKGDSRQSTPLPFLKNDSELCAVCRRRAYPMDALIVDKKKYHKSCFCCEHCRNKLSLGNYVSLHGHFYCQPHYKQLLKSKGIYEDKQKRIGGTTSESGMRTQDEVGAARMAIFISYLLWRVHAQVELFLDGCETQ